jgi:hypothetical protein
MIFFDNLLIKKNSASKLKKVEVIWEDVVSISRTNLNIDFDEFRLFKTEIGYLVKNTAEYIVIGHDLDLSGGSNSYLTLIPKSIIKKIKYL